MSFADRSGGSGGPGPETCFRNLRWLVMELMKDLLLPNLMFFLTIKYLLRQSFPTGIIRCFFAACALQLAAGKQKTASSVFFRLWCTAAMQLANHGPPRNNTACCWNSVHFRWKMSARKLFLQYLRIPDESNGSNVTSYYITAQNGRLQLDTFSFHALKCQYLIFW